MTHSVEPQQPDASDDQFRISQPRRIASILRDAKTRNSFITLESSRGASLVTTLLDVDNDGFICDWGSDHAQSLAVLTGGSCRFALMVGGVPVRFQVGALTQTTWEGKPAFQSVLPDDLLYLQRREFFRARARVSGDYVCAATLPDGRAGKLAVHDVSIGGVGLRSRDVSPESMPVGSLIDRATLDFHELGKVNAPLEVVACRKVKDVGGGLAAVHHFGCAFVELGREEPAVQKLVFALEKADRK